MPGRPGVPKLARGSCDPAIQARLQEFAKIAPDSAAPPQYRRLANQKALSNTSAGSAHVPARQASFQSSARPSLAVPLAGIVRRWLQSAAQPPPIPQPPATCIAPLQLLL